MTTKIDDLMRENLTIGVYNMMANATSRLLVTTLISLFFFTIWSCSDGKKNIEDVVVDDKAIAEEKTAVTAKSQVTTKKSRKPEAISAQNLSQNEDIKSLAFDKISDLENGHVPSEESGFHEPITGGTKPKSVSKVVPKQKPAAKPIKRNRVSQKKVKSKSRLGFNVGNFLIVKTDGANIRSSPSIKSKIIGQVANGENVQVKARKGKWVKIGKEKWVSQKTLSALHLKLKIKKNKVLVKKQPNSNSKTVEVLKKGAVVYIQTFIGKWAKLGTRKYVRRGDLDFSR